MMRVLLLGVVLAYRAIPARWRGRACAAIGRPKSMSHIALAGLRAGDTAAFRIAYDTWLEGPLAFGRAIRSRLTWLDDPWKGPSS